MASRIKPAEAAKTISDALGVARFAMANLLVAIGEFTVLFNYIGTLQSPYRSSLASQET